MAQVPLSVNFDIKQCEIIMINRLTKAQPDRPANPGFLARILPYVIKIKAQIYCRGVQIQKERAAAKPLVMQRQQSLEPVMGSYEK